GWNGSCSSPAMAARSCRTTAWICDQRPTAATGTAEVEEARGDRHAIRAQEGRAAGGADAPGRGPSMTIPGVGDPMALTASETLAAMEPGTRSVADLPVEDDLDVPLTLLRGHAERPVGAVVAGVHGDEVE